MAQNMAVLITGANKGIGLALASSIIHRPNTTLIATIRSTGTSTADLQALTIGLNSKLIIETLPVTSDTAAEELVSSLTNKHGITKLDVVIANAGHGDADSFKPITATETRALRENFEVNTLGPIKLFQATLQHMKQSPDPKFALITAMLGSIAGMQGPLAKAPTLAHGASKAGASFFVRKAHFEQEDITTFAIAPGWLPIGIGLNFGKAIGVATPPNSIEDGIKGTLEQIDKASRSTTSGNFIDWKGETLPW